MAYPKVLPVCSLKGGVGKSFVTANLARAFARLGYRTGALDADYHAPNLPITLGCLGRPHRGPGDTVIPPSVDGVKVLSWSMVWPEDSAVMVEDNQIDADDLRLVSSMLRGAVVSEEGGCVTLMKQRMEAVLKYVGQLIDHPGGAMEHMRLLLDPGAIEWGDLDWLLIDTPPESTGTTRIVAESHGVVGALIVSHPSRVSLADVRRTADLFRKKSVPIMGLVSNQGTQDTTSGPQRYDLTDADLRAFAESLGIPFICALPHAPEAALAPYFDSIVSYLTANQPVTLIKKAVDEAAAEEVVRTARKLADLLEVLKK